MNVQRYTDAFLARTLLPLIPQRISPNMVSWARIGSLPLIAYALFTDLYILGFFLFAIAALTDALDGALARTRDRVTETGKVLDAMADRGLIALVAIVFIPRLFGWWLLLALGVLEIGNGVAAYRARITRGVNPGANWAGKVKMVLQCIAFLILFAGLINGQHVFITFAYALLITSLPFTAIQMLIYPSTTTEPKRA